MQNLKMTTTGRFRYDHEISREGNKVKLVRFEVSYTAGASRKGVTVSINNKTIEQREGYHTETFEVFAGVSMWAKFMARKSDKIVAQVVEALDSSVVDLVNIFIAQDADAAKIALKDVIAAKVPQ